MKALTHKKHYKCTHSLLNYWRSQDVFGERVEFTYKGKSSYQTNIGAFVSVCIKIILYLFIAYEFYVIFKRKHPKISIKHSVKSFV